jgi:hypothetical protein
MHYTTAQALGRARLAGLHDQARRDALACAARQARRALRQQSGHQAHGLLAVITGWARHTRSVPGSLG